MHRMPDRHLTRPPHPQPRHQEPRSDRTLAIRLDLPVTPRSPITMQQNPVRRTSHMPSTTPTHPPRFPMMHRPIRTTFPTDHPTAPSAQTPVALPDQRHRRRRELPRAHAATAGALRKSATAAPMSRAAGGVTAFPACFTLSRFVPSSS